MANDIDKAKMMCIIKTLLITQPNRDWTSRNLAEFMNTHRFNISTEVNASKIGYLLRQEAKTRTSYLYNVEKTRVKGNRNIYRLNGE